MTDSSDAEKRFLPRLMAGFFLPDSLSWRDMTQTPAFWNVACLPLPGWNYIKINRLYDSPVLQGAYEHNEIIEKFFDLQPIPFT